MFPKRLRALIGKDDDRRTRTNAHKDPTRSQHSGSRPVPGRVKGRTSSEIVAETASGSRP